MTVRVKAMMKSMQQTYTLEKVVGVIPESLVQKKMESRYFSFETYKNESFYIPLDIFKQADNGSTKIEFRLNPNPLLDYTISSLENLLAVPSQDDDYEMELFAQNIAVMDYIHANGSNNRALILKATSLLRQGYRKQMRYRQTIGSFGLWQNKGGSVFYTAFVAKTMQTAAKYITDVDENVIEKACDWLISRQQSPKRFNEVGPEFQKNIQGGLRDGVALTSFVVTALLENENSKMKHATLIHTAMDYLGSQVDSLNDAYEVCIATYALMLYGHSKKDKAFKKLIFMSTASNNGKERYWESTNKIEATGYALLSFVLAEKYEEGIPIMRWLVNQRFVSGDYLRTQDTFVGLKALTKWAEKFAPSRNDYTIQLKYNKATQNFRIKSQDNSINTFKYLSEDIKAVEINVCGIGAGLLEVFYEYSLNLVNFRNRFKLDIEKQNTGSDYELRLKVCANFIRIITDERSNKVMVEVTFPSGYVVDRNPISEQTTVNQIRNTEIRYGGRSVVVYYDRMGIERNCFTVTAYRRGKVAMKRPGYVVVYDCNDPNLNAIELYDV